MRKSINSAKQIRQMNINNCKVSYWRENVLVRHPEKNDLLLSRDQNLYYLDNTIIYQNQNEIINYDIINHCYIIT